jgi:hypothetical protein
MESLPAHAYKPKQFGGAHIGVNAGGDGGSSLPRFFRGTVV